MRVERVLEDPVDRRARDLRAAGEVRVAAVPEVQAVVSPVKLVTKKERTGMLPDRGSVLAVPAKKQDELDLLDELFANAIDALGGLD